MVSLIVIELFKYNNQYVLITRFIDATLICSYGAWPFYQFHTKPTSEYIHAHRFGCGGVMEEDPKDEVEMKCGAGKCGASMDKSKK